MLLSITDVWPTVFINHFDSCSVSSLSMHLMYDYDGVWFHVSTWAIICSPEAFAAAASALFMLPSSSLGSWCIMGYDSVS